MSRAQRKEAFVEAAERTYDALEDWYDDHPEASFEEIEAVAREERRKLMGRGLAVLVNGRDSGYQLAGITCQQCGHPMNYKGAGFCRTIRGLEGATELDRAYYVCPNCEGEAIFPLDKKLGLRKDRWGGGVARVIARFGLREPSFELAAEGYEEAVGESLLGASVRRVTQGFGD